MKFLSICSGIEAASVAWKPLGWECVGVSEIEAFPSALLKARYPTVPNLGDMTKFRDWPETILAEVDLIVGGCPCQAFSVAGLRNSLDDDRGNLTLTYVHLINHIDAIRIKHGKPRIIVVYENVPGILSTKDNAFGHLIGALCGQAHPIETESGKWPKACILWGEERGVGYRTFDAQYFAVAQRRRRIFVVAVPNEFISDFGDQFCPSQILLIAESLRGDPAPSRGKRQEATSFTSSSFGGYSQGVGTLRTNGGDLGGGSETITLNVKPFDYQSNCEFGNGEVSHTLAARDYKGPTDLVAYGIPGNWIGRSPENGGNAIEPMLDVAPCQTKTDVHAVAYAFDSLSSNSMKSKNPNSGCNEAEVSKTIDTIGLNSSCNQGGNAILQNLAYAIQGSMIGRSDTAGPQGDGINENVSFTQNTTDRHGVAFEIDLNPNVSGTLASSGGGMDRPAGQGNEADFCVTTNTMQVRRLTPVECARLQGFPDYYLDITFNGKPATDTVKYKALGNSMAVPVMAWIGLRIAIASIL